jgi:hypothetical protein
VFEDETGGLFDEGLLQGSTRAVKGVIKQQVWVDRGELELDTVEREMEESAGAGGREQGMQRDHTRRFKLPFAEAKSHSCFFF